jgi:hypothetical protein
MPSGIYTTLRLDPFYQEFLRAQFNQWNPVFTFPKGHDLLLRLERYLTTPPIDFKLIEFGEESFRVEIPYMEIKNPNVYFYLSDKKMKLFNQRTRDYFREIFHEEIRKYRSKNFNKNEAIICFMEDFRISERYEDRLIKAYNRYMEIERMRRFRCRQKRRKSLSVYQS